MTDVAGRVREELVLGLDDARALDPALVGAKAACLARARDAGLPVVDGFVITTAVHARFVECGHALPDAVAPDLVHAWADLAGPEEEPVVVRSSSSVEDVAASSMAGRFRSVLKVRGRTAFLNAVVEVLRSGDEVGGAAGASPMGVLVQCEVFPTTAGVMFGIDPVTGDTSTVVVEAVAGSPEKLVGGRVTAQRYVTTRSGRLRTLDRKPVRAVSRRHRERRLLGTPQLVALARLARRAHRVFGSPQDVEWAFQPDGRLLLLQSRPVTAIAARPPVHGPVLGPGPLAETFPDPLSVLEQDLWLRPLRAGVVEALAAAGVVARGRLDASPVVTTVAGRVAADLELFGLVPTRSAWAFLDPRPAFRQLAAAWRTGLMRAELPHRAARLVAEVDASLTAAEIDEATDDELIELLRSAGTLLRRLHHAEVLAGTLLPSAGHTAAELALHALHQEAPETDTDVVRRRPVVLSLVPPSLAGDPALPPAPATVGPACTEPLGPREALRLRVRWVQELTARVCRELERRLDARGALPEPDAMALLRVDEIVALVHGRGLPADLHERRAEELAGALGTPLPAEFRLGNDGSAVPVARQGARPEAGVPAGGGRAVGRAVHGSTRRPPAPGDVLVVRELQPGLAAYLPGLAGLVAETGSTLSHLAILAREYDVPAVVAVHDALRRFPAGSRVFVDGGTGDVRIVDGSGPS
ncbi:MAG: PEP/pyruvate-binding domain-containing protein [Nocardioides sp.]